MEVRPAQPARDYDISGLQDAVTSSDCIEQAARLFRTIGNADRLALLWHLSRGECSVSELEQVFNVRQPTMSQRLSVLRAAGLLATRRDGKTIYYRVVSDDVRQCLDLTCRLFGTPTPPEGG